MQQTACGRCRRSNEVFYLHYDSQHPPLGGMCKDCWARATLKEKTLFYQKEWLSYHNTHPKKSLWTDWETKAIPAILDKSTLRLIKGQITVPQNHPLAEKQNGDIFMLVSQDPANVCSYRMLTTSRVVLDSSVLFQVEEIK